MSLLSLASRLARRLAGFAVQDEHEQPLLLTDLPANLLELIVSLLPNAEDIARVDCVSTTFHVPPPPAAVPPGAGPPARRFSVVAQALMMRLPKALADVQRLAAQPHVTLNTTQVLLKSEVQRRCIFFRGVLEGKVSDDDYDEDIHQNEGDPNSSMDPFDDYPSVHGHLELPIGWEGPVAGLYTIDGNPHDDGEGPLIFGITGTITPDKLNLSFDYNSTMDPSDDEGHIARLKVSSRIPGQAAGVNSQSLLDFLKGLGRDAVVTGPWAVRKKCRLRGTYYQSWPTYDGERGTAKLTLTAIQRVNLEMLEGEWSESWKDEDGDDEHVDTYSGLGKVIRKGPHPSLYPRSLLAVLEGVHGCTIGGKWPYGRASWNDREKHAQALSSWLQQYSSERSSG